VLADAQTVLAALVPALLEKPLPGYGPRRAHYALSLACELAERHHDLRLRATGQASASRAKHDAARACSSERQTFLWLLTMATRGHTAWEAKLRKAAVCDTRKS
jgi:hypothetical protein